MSAIDITGKQFGRWTAVQRADKPSYKGKRRRNFWLCRCVCGREKVVECEHLLRGRSRSCGCIISEKGNAFKHGLSDTSEYRSWSSMFKRCCKPNCKAYKYYGGRGISICERWSNEHGFENFISDMGMKPSSQYSLDRIDVNGNYEPKNCRWATDMEQNNNRRLKKIEDFSDTELLQEIQKRPWLNGKSQ